MDLSRYRILDIYGVSRIELRGDYTAETLTAKLISEWVPYVECDRKCSRFDYCKYTKASPYHPDRLTDVKCGVVVAALTNLVRATFSILESLPHDQVENYLDGAFHFTQFVLSAEHMIGMCTDEGVIESYDHYAPAFFGHITRLRDVLNSLASSFREIPDFRTSRGVLFVEGWTEKTLLEKLKESHSSWFLHLIVEVYYGTGNRRPKRIQMLLDNYQKQGYTVYLQGDGDGKGINIFNELVRKGSVGQECTFIFEHDFESSVPAPLLFGALKDLGELNGVEKDSFVQQASGANKPVVSLLEEQYGLKLEPLKIDLADAIGNRLNSRRWAWWQDEVFMNTELGQFLRFVQSIV